MFTTTSMNNMNILVIGSGGREHALCWAIANSPQCKEVFVAPGNAGMSDFATRVKIRPTDFDEVIEFCREKLVDFVVIGPEAPLVAGLTDFLEDRGIKVFGPSREAAQLEASKAYMKDVAAAAGVPTAKYARFKDADAAKAYIREQGAPIVVKADGLAAGKGVVVAESVDEALAAIDEIMVEKQHGDAGDEVLIEECMFGREASFFVACNNDKVFEFGTACDYKRVGEGDVGPNTGGMGTFSPADMVDEKMAAEIMEKIINPTLVEMKKRGAEYKGFLFAGLMMTSEGPKLIEYNCRMGDPETQSILPRLQSDILETLLGNAAPKFSDEHAVCVVYAANGYPKAYEKNTVIKGLEHLVNDSDEASVFHAGTAHKDKQWVSFGGRVLGVVAKAATLEQAKASAYMKIEKIDWSEGFYRKDIGEIYE